MKNLSEDTIMTLGFFAIIAVAITCFTLIAIFK